MVASYAAFIVVLTPYIVCANVDICVKLRQRVCGCYNPSYWPMCQRHIRDHWCMSEWTGEPAVKSQRWVVEWLLHSMQNLEEWC